MKIFQICIILAITLFSCSNSETRIDNSHFDEQSGILEIEYNEATDDYLLPILQHSHIRDEGYGILLNIEKVVTQKKLKSITGSFRKRDINAVHIFIINRDSLPNNTRIAIEGARFTWLFIGNEQDPYPACEQLKAPLRVSIDQGGIIVIDHSIDKNLKKCLRD